MSFETLFDQFDWDRVQDDIHSRRSSDVERALSRSGECDLEDFKALLSPAAAPYLEEMARKSREITLRRFGRVIQLYVPLYLSNECQNICTYCGFSLTNKLPRITLNRQQVMREVEIIKAMGFDHVLLVTGEANQTVDMGYFREALEWIRPHFSQISMEVQPLEEDEYRELIGLGLTAVLVYQETYHRATYRDHHPKGRKSNFRYRLDTPDRLGRAGIRKIGLGALIGLEDWRTDSFFTALHLTYLQRTYWQTRYSVSFPRLRPFSGGLAPKVDMSDRELVQLICAYRLLNEDLELSLSTREHPLFRDHAVHLGINTMSAGSRTEPGGYAAAGDQLEQFEVGDHRSPEEVAHMIRTQGYEAVWKDWDRSYDLAITR